MNCPRCNAPATEETLREFGGVCPKCLLQFSEEKDAPAFPNLEIIEMIGQGGMGVVYKARQKNLDRIVALKVLSPQLSEDPEFVGRFTREAKALAQLSHPNIVGIHDSGIHDRVPYLVMEYIDGTPLRNAMAGGKLTPARALEVIPQICDALQYAHSHGIVHRDIKPENILIDRQGRVKIADFGLAKLSVEHSRLTQSGFVMGTPRYMAPEQFEPTGRVDHRADIYSLGVVFYEMLTGEVPMGKFKPPSAKADVDERLDPVVLKSLEREPQDRYQSAHEVKQEVADLHSRKPPSPPAPPAHREFWKAAAIIAGIAVPMLIPVAIINLVSGSASWAMLAPGLVLLGVAGLVGLAGLLVYFANRPPRQIQAAEIELERTQNRGCLLMLIVAGVIFLGFIVIVTYHERSAPPAVPVPAPAVVAGGGGKSQGRTAFRLEDAWPRAEDLPSGLRLENVVEGKAAVPEKGKLADAFPDLKLVRKATLAEGRVVLFGFEFKTDYARKRWVKEMSLLPVKFENGREPEGRSLFYLGRAEAESTAAGTVAMEMIEPVLQRKMKDAAAKYRE